MRSRGCSRDFCICATGCFYDADASSEPGCSRDQKQPCPDDDGPDGSRDALTSRCETFDGDGCRHGSHHAQVHDPDDQEDRRRTGAAVAAVKAEAKAVSPGRAGVGRQRMAAPGRRPAAGKVMRLPRGELDGAGDQDDHTDRDRTACASAGCCISIAAGATPSGKAAIPKTAQTNK